MHSRGTASRACAFLLILRFLRTLCAVACAHLVRKTVLYTVVCVYCACGSGKKSPFRRLFQMRKPICSSDCFQIVFADRLNHMYEICAVELFPLGRQFLSPPKVCEDKAGRAAGTPHTDKNGVLLLCDLAFGSQITAHGRITGALYRRVSLSQRTRAYIGLRTIHCE